MIHLDTNYVIGLVASPSPFQADLFKWLRAGELMAVSAIAWSEFLSGPVKDHEIQLARGMIKGRIVSFGTSEAELAAKLFNETGRRRGSKPDCFIAATAICARASLATRNVKDFRMFVPLGLKLA